MLSFFPRGVLDEILNLIESVSEGFPSYSWCINSEKISGKNDFPDFPYHFKKIIVRYKKIGYNINVMRQTACLLVNPIKVNIIAYLLNRPTAEKANFESLIGLVFNPLSVKVFDKNRKI